MKKKLFSMALCLLLAISLLPATAKAAVPTDSWEAHTADSYAGGTGTQADPYQIATPEALAKLAADTNSGDPNKAPDNSDYFLLTADIDLGGKLWQPIGRHLGGNSFAAFSGHFDGGGKTISNMTVRTDTTDASGLFGKIVAASDEYVVRSLTLKGADIVSTAQSGSGIDNATVASGVLAGSASPMLSASVVLDGCKVVDSTVTGTVMTGGLLGDCNYGKITNSSVTGTTVTGGGYTGGLTGNAFASEITACTVDTLTLKGAWSVGGFTGCAYSGSLTGCEVKNADVTATDWNAGGFAGYVGAFDGTMALKDCKTQMTIHSTVAKYEPRVGGFAGFIEACSDISNCTSLGKITSDRADGKTVGAFAGKISADLPISGCCYDDRSNPGLPATGNDIAYSADRIGSYYADYTAVDKAVAAANALDKNLYKDFSAVTAAIGAVDRTKLAVDQKTVDGYAAAINTAVAALAYKSADYTAVDKAVAAADALDKDLYKDFSAVTAAIGAVDRTKNITEQSVVDGYAKAIENAMQALEAQPRIVDGKDQTVPQGVEASFRSSAALKDFQKVLVDGKEVDPSNYTLKEGSTIVILKPAFLKTLGGGKHTISIVSTTGTASTEFAVTAAAEGKQSDTTAPGTGDRSAVTVWAALLSVSACGVWVVKRRRGASR